MKRKTLQVIGDRLRDARKAKKWTQAELAEKIGSSSNHVGGIERGTENPTVAKVCAICKALAIDAGTVFKGLPVMSDQF